jgi:hypothetical protein
MRMNKDFLKGMVVGFLLSVVAAYSVFRIYWIMEIGVRFFRWHAVLWLYLFIAAIFFGLGYLLLKTGRLKTAGAQKMALVALGLFLGIYLMEIVLRLKGGLTTYTEKREGVFVNPAERMQKAWYLTYEPNEKRELSSGSEYSFERTTNSEGLPDKEWTTAKDSNEIRIMTLGDSFTEGDGCEYDSSYPRVLEGLLQKEFPQVKINVLNAGRRGSDPWFEYKKLHDRLLKYKPDFVVYTNGSNDMLFDHLNYGGMERFLSDSTVKNRVPQHSWLGLYEVSYVFRLVMEFAGYDNTLFSHADRKKNKVESLDNAREISKEYNNLGKENGFICIQVVRPDKFEIEQGYYDFDLKQLTAGTDTLSHLKHFDLLAFFKSIGMIESTVDAYFWKVDQHHNAKGYEAMARGVFSALKPEVAKHLTANLYANNHL